MKTQCQYLNQRNHSFGKLTGAQCKKEANFPEVKNHGTPEATWFWFCKVHSYTADRFIGARNQSGYITQSTMRDPAADGRMAARESGE